MVLIIAKKRDLLFIFSTAVSATVVIIQWVQKLLIALKIQRALRAVETHVLDECIMTDYLLMCPALRCSRTRWLRFEYNFDLI